MAKSEKVAYILEQVRLCLDKKDYVRAQVRKAFSHFLGNLWDLGVGKAFLECSCAWTRELCPRAGGAPSLSRPGLPGGFGVAHGGRG